jgi:lysyl-tRNA synthetase, class II
MGREEQIIGERVRKLNEIKEQGINPYPNKFERTHTCDELQSEYVKLKNEVKAKGKVKVAGRVMAKRDMGKISFGKLKDGSGTIQIISQEGESDEKTRRFFKKYIDSGDFVGISGIIIRSKRGELSILIKEITLLSKSTLPLPEKWHGITDEEERYRKRYLDILMNDEVKDMFLLKSRFWNTIRSFLIDKGFIEVETPILENSAGGASATPFSTHHNALDLDVYLRISMGELWQKKLMIAGFDKTFEIGRQFRNEGMDMEHLQDYTQMEFYWAYANYEDGMKLVEELYKKIAKDVFGTSKFKTHGHAVDFSKKWIIYDYEKTIKKYTDINIYDANATQIKKKLDKLKVEYDANADKWRLVDVLWKVARKKLNGPGFLTGQPVEVSPLAKRNPKDPRKVEQFQVIIAGSEMGNGYSELNDAMDQEERFMKQAEQNEAGDTESMEHDKGFVEALKHGMPPTCGFGVSERLFGFLVDKPLRECVLFPLMKPEETDVKK